MAVIVLKAVAGLEGNCNVAGDVVMETVVAVVACCRCRPIARPGSRRSSRLGRDVWKGVVLFVMLFPMVLLRVVALHVASMHVAVGEGVREDVGKGEGLGVG